MYETGSTTHKAVKEALAEATYFSEEEFTCSCGCGSMLMDLAFLRILFKIREEYGDKMIITSGYRCSLHPDEVIKDPKIVKRRFHQEGIAADVKVTSKSGRARLIRLAHIHGLKGVGVANDFVHLDNRTWDALYTYKGTR